MKFNFRKIASVLTSTVMLSSTVALAAAANYPAPYVKGGNADVAVVYGANAALSDVAAVVDITSSLQAELAKQTAVGGSSGSSGTSVSGGDYVVLNRPADMVNMGNTISGVWGSTVSSDDLKSLLKTGIYHNKKNTDYKYDQRITLGSALRLEFLKDSDFNSNKPSVGINLTSSQDVLNYTLSFQTQPTSTVTSGDLVDFETTNIDILGKNYYVLDFKNNTAKMTLLDSATTALVSGAETKTVTVGDKSYDVKITFIGTTKTKLNVNGEDSDTLNEGDTFKLSDGTYIGIRSILYNAIQGETGSVEFSIGSGKLEITNAASVKLNDKSYSDLTGFINKGATSSDGKENLNTIVFQWRTNDKKFIAPGTDLTMPGFEALKLSLGDFAPANPEVTKVNGDGSYVAQLQTTVKNGDVTIPLYFTNTSGAALGIGKGISNRLVTSNSTSGIVYNYTGGDRMLVATYNTSNSGETYLIRFNNIIQDNDAGNKTDVDYMSDGSWTNKYTGSKAGDTLTFGSLTLTVSNVFVQGSEKVVRINGTGSSSFNTLYTKNGLKVDLPFVYQSGVTALNTAVKGAIPINGTNALYGQTVDAGQSGASLLGTNETAYGSPAAGHGYSSIDLNFTEEDKTDTLAAGNAFGLRLGSGGSGSSFYVDVNSANIGRTLLQDTSDTNNYVGRVYSDLASEVWQLGPTSATRTAKITYPSAQTSASPVLTAKGATVTSDNSGSSSGDGSVKVLGSVSVSDSEASSVSGKNLIVVGGSCINSVAASLLGSALCGADFTTSTGVGAGQFLIQTFDRTGGKVATLVAGYNAGDTTNAAKYLSTQTVDTTVGKKYKGTSATTASMEATNSTA